MSDARDTAEHPTVETGFALDLLYFHRLVLESVSGDDLPDLAFQDVSGIAWDWAWLAHDVFDVNVTVEIRPTKERSERIIAAAIGRFRIVGPELSTSLERFVQYSGPALLFPFIRQQIVALTAAGRFGPFLLPPINVQALMSNMDPTKATASQKGRPSASGRAEAARVSG